MIKKETEEFWKEKSKKVEKLLTDLISSIKVKISKELKTDLTEIKSTKNLTLKESDV